MMTMRECIGEPAMYEMLAEECTELAHAALKMARILRSENPTPRTWEEVRDHLTEEMSDVHLCAKELGIDPDREIEETKIVRFYKRWQEMKGVNQDAEDT